MHRAPHVLIIGLLRSKPVSPGLLAKKRHENVIFPLSIDLTEFAHSDKRLIYDCFAVNNHLGEMSNGHYFAYCKDPNGKWYRYDDSNVTELPTSDVISQNAYSMF